MRRIFIIDKYPDNDEIIKLDRQIKKLQFEYDAESETYIELKLDDKLEKAKEKFKEKHLKLTKLRAKYQEELDTLIKRGLYNTNKLHSEVSKMQLFMDVLKLLEGENKIPVEEELFVTELIKKNFTEEEARNYVGRMLREASIYQSRPGYYNRI